MSALTEVENYDATITGPDGGSPRNASSVRTMGTGAANRTKWLSARIAELMGVYLAGGVASAATDTITLVAHGLSNNQPIRFYAIAGQSLPAPLAAATVYYVFSVDADNFKVRASVGGSAINLTTSGGSWFVVPIVDAVNALYTIISGIGQTVKSAFALTSASQDWQGALNHFENDVMVDGDFTSTNVNTTAIALTGDMSITGALTRSGVNAKAPVRYHAQADGNPTLNTDYDVYRLATPSANRTITLKSTSPAPVAGDTITIVRGSAGAFNHTIQREDTTVVATFTMSAWGSGRFVFDGTIWTAMQLSGGATAGAGA
jgi:hypothetical protein